MKLWKRRTILILSLLLFLLLSPTIILYSSGYRLDFANFSLKKVGMIIIDSKPKDVNVIINNKLVADKTPYKNSNLTPKNYFVKLEKPNYQAWGKNLPVESQTVTWISNALLFLSDPIKDEYAQENNIIESQISPDQKYYAYIIKDSNNSYILRLIDLKSRININLFNLSDWNNQNIIKDFNPNNISNILWSNDGKKVLVNLNGKKDTVHIIINLNDQRKIIVIDERNLNNIKWDLSDSNFIYFLSETNLGKTNINNQEISYVIANNVKDYDLVSNSIIYAKQNKNDNELYSSIYLINKNNIEINQTDIYSVNILNEEIKRIKAQKENLFLIQTKDNNLYLSDNENLLKIAPDILNFEWSDSEKFLFYNKNNIWFYQIKKDKNVYHPEYPLNENVPLNLVLDNIEYACWHSDSEYIIFISGGNMSISELDNRDITNNFSLVNNVFNPIKNNPTINSEGDKLFYIENSVNEFKLIEATIYEK